MIYAPFMFWFWDRPLDAKKHRDEMVDMARCMLKQRLNPGYAHARLNMVGAPELPRRQWLSPLWFDTFERILNEAKQQGGYFGYCDDYWWPSGRAAGRVLRKHPDLWACSLRCSTLDVPGDTLLDLPAAFFVVAAQLDGSSDLAALAERRRYMEQSDRKTDPALTPHLPARIRSNSLQLLAAGSSIQWRAPAGVSWRIYMFDKYYHPGADGGRLNYLDSRLARAFIELAHEPYARRAAPFLGETLPGVFQDHEGDYGYKLAWSDDLGDLYRRTTGRDIRKWMPLLFDRDAEGVWASARWQWFEAVSELYASFFSTLNDWLGRRNCYLISNLWEESLMWQASAVGDFFKVQRAFSMPGCDALGLSVLRAHDFVETGSVAEFENRRFQSEILGGAGWRAFTPVTLKRAANAVVARGVSHVVAHGIFSTRMFDHHPWVPDWYDENPMWPFMNFWSDFIRRACYINSHGCVAADVLLLNPMDSIWALCGPGVFDPAYKGRVPGPAILPQPSVEDIPRSRAGLKRESAWWTAPVMENWYSEAARAIDAAYCRAIDDLIAGGISFLIADRHYLRQMTLSGDALHFPPWEFKAIITPPLFILPLDIAAELVRFVRAGGRLYCLGQLPGASVERGCGDPAIADLTAELVRHPNTRLLSGALAQALDRGAPGLSPHLRSDMELLHCHRIVDGRHFYWLADTTGRYQNGTVRLAGVRGAASQWDPETGEIRSLGSESAGRDLRLQLDFAPYQAFWLVVDGSSAAEAELPPRITRSSVRLARDWRVRIPRHGQPRLEHPSSIAPSWIRWRAVELDDWREWGLASFSGYMDYERFVDLNPAAKEQWILDLGRVDFVARLWVNGVEIGRRLWPPFRFDITTAVKDGRNRIRVRVGNLVSNSYGQPVESGLRGPVRLERRVNR